MSLLVGVSVDGWVCHLFAQNVAVEQPVSVGECTR